MDNKNLWPLAIEYIQSLETLADGSAPQGCFLCHYFNQPDRDEQNLVLCAPTAAWSSSTASPTPAPHAHRPPRPLPNLDGLDDPTLLELLTLARDVSTSSAKPSAPRLQRRININRCAGAGLPDHVHLHVVPAGMATQLHGRYRPGPRRQPGPPGPLPPTPPNSTTLNLPANTDPLIRNRSNDLKSPKGSLRDHCSVLAEDVQSQSHSPQLRP